MSRAHQVVHSGNKLAVLGVHVGNLHPSSRNGVVGVTAARLTVAIHAAIGANLMDCHTIALYQRACLPAYSTPTSF